MGGEANTKAKALRALRNNERYNDNINLENRGLGDSGAVDLSGPLRHNTTVEQLSLSGNSIGVRGARALADAIRNNTTLKVLDLDKNNIRSSGARAIADAIKENSTLEKLYLSANGIGEDAGRELAEVIRTSTTLKELYLGGNSMGDVGVRLFADAIKENLVMEKLYLRSNDIGEGGGHALLNGIRNNSSLTYLNIRNNNISSSLCEQIQEHIKGTEKKVTKDSNAVGSSSFYEKILEEEGEQPTKLSTLIPLIEDVHQMKLYYTYVCMLHRVESIVDDTRRKYIQTALEHSAKTCTMAESLAVYKVILDKAEQDGIIDPYLKHLYDNDAEVARMQRAPFIQNIVEAVHSNTGRIEGLEATVQSLSRRIENLITTVESLSRRIEHNEANIEAIQSNVEAINDSVNALKEGIRRKHRIEACTSFVGAVLNALSFGVAGSAVKGALDVTLGAIVDFGDVTHIQSIVDASQDVTVKDSFQFAIQIAAGKAERKLADAAAQENPLIAITAVAQYVSVQVPSTMAAQAIPPVQVAPVRENAVASTSKVTLLQRVEKLEEELGVEGEGAIRDRVSHLEDQFFGPDNALEGNLKERVENLEKNLFGG